MVNCRRPPSSRSSASGFERTILKKLPMVLLGGTLIALFVSIGTRFYLPEGNADKIASHLVGVDILSIAVVVTLWMTAIPVALGCCVVLLMKGPVYIADTYPLDDSEQPQSDKARKDN